jgi:murein DD-endopeptidase MepM/ murein hydrolase activator NlpD
LRLPLQCAPGVDCWISNHVDLDPGSGRRDYSCGALTYNAHNGTDFALRDLHAMRAGVAVLAAAAGTVLGSRDGMPDASVRETGLAPVRDRECGNGLRLDHGEGLETQYCHLRLGSVTVRPGERVVAGQALGLVGMSGLSEYPHLHFTVRYRGELLDPFRGTEAAPACGAGERPLWHPAVLAVLPYAAGAIYNYGIAPFVPSAVEVREGRQQENVVPRDAAQLVVWLEAFGVSAGDVLNVRVRDAAGQTLLEHRSRFERTQARVFRAVGRKRGAEPWSAGAYTAEIAVGRGAVHRLSFEVR